RHDIHDQREVQHLLDGDAGQDLLPSCDRVGLLRGQALIGLGPEAETRVQVLAHDHVLELRCLDQQAPQLLAVLDHKPCLRHQHSRQARLAQLPGSSHRPWMKTTGVRPEALAAWISRFSRSDIDAMRLSDMNASFPWVKSAIARRYGVVLANGTIVALAGENRLRKISGESPGGTGAATC